MDKYIQRATINSCNVLLGCVHIDTSTSTSRLRTGLSLSRHVLASVFGSVFDFFVLASFEGWFLADRMLQCFVCCRLSFVTLWLNGTS